MISHYLGYINVEAQQSQQKLQDIQVEIEDLQQAQTALVNQLKTNEEKIKDKKKLISKQAFKLYELEEEYELEKGRSQCYKLQMVELEQTIRRLKDEHADELARERGTTHTRRLG